MWTSIVVDNKTQHGFTIVQRCLKFSHPTFLDFRKLQNISWFMVCAKSLNPVQRRNLNSNKRFAIMYGIVRVVSICLTPLFMLFGVFGNMTSLLLLYPGMYFTEPGTMVQLYFSCLAVSDTASLLLSSSRDLLRHAVNVNIVTEIDCSVYLFVHFTVNDFGACLLIILSVDRYLYAHHQSVSVKIVNEISAKFTLLLCGVLVLALNFPIVVVFDSIESNKTDRIAECLPSADHPFFKSDWLVFQGVFYYIIPSVTAMCFIAGLIYSNIKNYPNHTRKPSPGTNSATVGKLVLFTLTHLPLNILLFTNPGGFVPLFHEDVPRSPTFALAEYVSYLNACLNVVVFSLAWRDFRDALKQKLFCLRRRRRDRVSILERETRF